MTEIKCGYGGGCKQNATEFFRWQKHISFPHFEVLPDTEVHARCKSHSPKDNASGNQITKEEYINEMNKWI